jgi:chromosome segregation ATPase
MSAIDEMMKAMEKEPTRPLDSAAFMLLFKTLLDNDTGLKNDMLGLRGDYQILNNKFDDVAKQLVGWPRCQQMREQCQREMNNKLDKMEPRLRNVETCLSVLNTEQEVLVSESELLKSEGKVISVAEKKDNAIITRLDKLDADVGEIKKKIDSMDWKWNTVKDYILKNRWVQITIAGISTTLGAILIEVTIGRLKDFGIIK